MLSRRIAVTTLVVSVLVPAAAVACPGGMAHGGGCGTSAGAYAGAIVIGLLVGAGSVVLERAVRKR